MDTQKELLLIVEAGIINTLENLTRLVNAPHNPGRELSLVRTKLDEARLWLQEVK